MIPGEIITKSTEIEINNHHPETVIEVENTGDRPIQVGSHFHFMKQMQHQISNVKWHMENIQIFQLEQLFDLNLGIKEVQLVEYAGKRKIFGFRGMVNGPIDESRVYRPTDENDEYAGVFGDNGAENVNKKEEKDHEL